jgi:N-acetylmuramoyl-L-alanine amidase
MGCFMATVVIDPGHGGTRAVGGSSANNAKGPRGTLEKTVTLSVGLAAKAALSAAGVTVLMTRETDVNLGLAERAHVARRAKAEIFVSIHFNGFNNRAQGTETWIARDATQRTRDFAAVTQNALLAVTGLSNRGVKNDKPLGVISRASHHPNTAAVLVEISFMDVAAEELRLGDPAYIARLGGAISQACVSYLRSTGALETVEEAIDDEQFEDGHQVLAGHDPSEGLRLQAVFEEAPEDTLEPGEVPFLPIATDKTFGDIGDASPVDDPERMLAGWRAVRNGVEPEARLEVAVGRDMSLPSAFLPIMADRRRSVGKISASGIDFLNRSGRWSGTGFLVGSNVLMTNHHVINSPEVARNATIDFEFEVPAPDFVTGTQEPASPGARRYKLDPSKVFLTSPARDGGLDYTFVWIEDEAARNFGSIPMQRAAFSVREGEQAFVVHHPNGRGKRVSLDDTDVMMINTTVVRYSSDTMPGSSGSPVFDRQGRLIALHHASQDQSTPIKLPDGGTSDVLNEGIKIAAIVLDLERRRSGSEADMVRTVLAEVRGSDTMSGFFGNLGRSETALLQHKTGMEAVVDSYKGSDDDVDVGFWNVEWLSRTYTDKTKLRMAASLIVDLGLDIWGLSEISPNAIEALVAEIKRNFGEIYDYALSEPHAPDGKQSTAVIWKRKTVSGLREAWPPEIEAMWGLDSRDPIALEAEHGKIFDRYPGLFKFSVKGRTSPFEFYVVPLHLKAMAEGSTRRKLASKLLARAIDLMIERYGKDQDWVLGGDYNAELATNDFQPLLAADFKPMSAQDEDAGAFSYIKSPKSLIDHVFLSPNLAKQAGDDSYFIVAKDKTVDNYARKLSDHRPVLVRFSIGGEAPQEERLDDIADEIFARFVKLPKTKAKAEADVHLQAEFEAAEDFTFQTAGLSKDRFLEVNRDVLLRLIDDVNARLSQQYGADCTRVTLLDAFVMITCEAGLKNGRVDPSHRHSEGERGLLPLPERIRDWNGPSAPDPNRLMPLSTNIWHFMMYLGQIKNKAMVNVGGRNLYRDLFQQAGISGTAAREARLIAGIVHGYFVKANYGGGPVPFNHILSSYAADVPLPQMMQGTSYRHAGTSVLTGRQRNIEHGLSLAVAELVPGE